MANDTRGVFRLRSLRQENVEGKGVDNLDVWLPYPDVNLSNYGYYVSGTTDSGPTLRSTVDRTDMSTDTTASLPSSPIPESSHDGVALGSLTHLYASGGWAVGTKVFKMTYSNETWATATSMARNTRSMGDNGVGTKLNGYVIMGDDTGYPGPENSTVQKLAYANDSWSQLPGFPYKSTWSMGASNDTSAIIAGGDTNNGGTETSRTYKLKFSNDSYLTLPGGMIQNASGPGNGQRAEASASGNATHMYVSSGRMPSGMSSTTIKYDYSADTWDRMPGANGSRTRRWNQAYGNTTHGYSAGGNSPSPNYSTVDKINYTNDTAAYTPGANLTVSRLKGVVASPRQNGWGASTSPGYAPYRWLDDAVEIKANHGYFGMGFPSSGNGDFKKLDFDTETVSPNYQFYSPGRQQFAVGSSLTHGYNLGGAYQGGAKSNVYKWDYATNSGSENPSKLNRTRRQSNSSSTRTHGYVVGGYSDFPTPDGTKTDISKYSFTTDTSLGNITGNLSTTNQAGMGAGNQEFGYHTQGSGTIIWKLTYSTDTVSTLTAQLPVYRYEMTPSTMANATTAYFVGGSQGPGAKSSTDKMDYSTDTLSAGTNLSNNAQRGQATSNTEVGYVVLGWNAPTGQGGTPVSAEVNKYDFATDTVTAKGNLFNHQPNTYSAALSVGMNNQSGLVPGPPEATPTLQKYYDAGGAGSSPNYGFYSSGNKSGGGWLADTIRIPFWTDSRSTVPSAGPGRINGQSVSSGLANYMVGGQTPTSYPGPALASYWKYTYSTTTNEQIPALLPNRDLGVPAGPAQNRLNQAGQSSAGAYAGYLSGGNYPGSPDSGSVSTTSKLEYSDETSSLVPTASLPVRAAMAVGMGRANDQSVYMAGGDDNIPSPNVGRMSYVTKISHVTGTASNALNLPSPSSHSCGTENSSNGYFGLGQMPNAGGGASSQMFKLTYSSETMARMPGADSTSAGYTLSGKMVMASTSHGYFSGGSTAAGGSYTEKLNFSNDTMAGAPGAGLNYAVSGGMSFSPRENGIGSSAPQFNPVYV